VSRFGRFPIQIIFAENANWTASPKPAAQVARQVAAPSRGPARVQGGLQGRRFGRESIWPFSHTNYFCGKCELDRRIGIMLLELM
jgi:hypothetical protein